MKKREQDDRWLFCEKSESNNGGSFSPILCGHILCSIMFQLHLRPVLFCACFVIYSRSSFILSFTIYQGGAKSRLISVLLVFNTKWSIHRTSWRFLAIEVSKITSLCFFDYLVSTRFCCFTTVNLNWLIRQGAQVDYQ